MKVKEVMTSEHDIWDSFHKQILSLSYKCCKSMGYVDNNDKIRSRFCTYLDILAVD